MDADDGGPRMAGRYVSPHVIEALDELSTACAHIITLIDAADIMLEQVDAPQRAAVLELVVLIRLHATAAQKQAQWLWRNEMPAGEVCHDG